MYIAKSPFWLRWLYPSAIWHKSRQEKSIYLTFDDGPIPVVTPFVLNTLKSFNAKATFFCIGDNVAKHPDIYQQVLDDGHSVGNHTYNHLKGWNTDNEVYFDNVAKCANLVKSNLFRPPYGRAKRSQISNLKSHYSIIMWDVLSGDFDTVIDTDRCVKNVISNAQNGSIIVFHDSEKAFPRLENALPKVLNHFTAKGFRFLPL